MKMRKKGKVHPSPSSSSSSSSSSSMPSASANRDAMSVLKLLPAAILALASVLSLEDREVLAYIITRSLKSYSNPSSIVEEEKISNKKKSSVHKSPVFDCGCFDCYTSYWFRWDSSPNRELIHQAIEAFEEHLATGEKEKRSGRGKRREKTSRRGASTRVEDALEVPVPEREPGVLPVIFDGFVDVLPENEASPAVLPEKVAETVWSEEENVEEGEGEGEGGEDSPEEMVAQLAVTAAINHKGLARKVLPDVLGLLNSRLWSLWSPNV